jgi:SNF2 family DNA or RNA helicase
LKDGVNLYPFQKVAAEYLEQSNRALLAMDMGLGKTITALAATSNLLESKKVKKPLIICPATLKFNWAIEIAKFTNYSYTMIDGDAKSRQKKYNNSSDFTIMNYDLLRHDIEFIQEIGWDLIIADEIQRAKNYNTEISKNIRLLQPEHIFGLTGTPLENSIIDLFTIMRFINSKMFGNNGMYFKQRYCDIDSWGKILGYRHDRDYELDRKTSYFMIRRKKRDVLKDLPEKTINNYYITLSAEERKVYNETKKRVISEINRSPENAINVLSQIVFLREICDSINLITPSHKVVSAKLDELKVILSDLPPESKVVIFTEYERMAQIIEAGISQQSVHLHGGIKNECRLEKELEKKVKQENKGLVGRELDLKIHEETKNAVCKNCPYFNDLEKCNTRKKVISKFNDDPEVKVLISTNAGKEGLNLQVANVLINFDLSFNPAVNEQRIARVDRIGQKSENITIINLVCVDTIEERILKILDEKQALFDKVIDKTDRDTLKRFNAQQLVELV